MCPDGRIFRRPVDRSVPTQVAARRDPIMARAKAIFRAIDDDGNGVLDKDEIARALASSGAASSSAAGKKAALMMAAADEDGDGPLRRARIIGGTERDRGVTSIATPQAR